MNLKFQESFLLRAISELAFKTRRRIIVWTRNSTSELCAVPLMIGMALLLVATPAHAWTWNEDGTTTSCYSGTQVMSGYTVTSSAIDANGHINVLYCGSDASNDNVLRLATYDGSNWSDSTLPSVPVETYNGFQNFQGGSPWGTSLAFDSSGSPHVAVGSMEFGYINEYREKKTWHIWKSGGVWQSENGANTWERVFGAAHGDSEAQSGPPADDLCPDTVYVSLKFGSDGVPAIVTGYTRDSGIDGNHHVYGIVAYSTRTNSSAPHWYTVSQHCLEQHSDVVANTHSTHLADVKLVMNGTTGYFAYWYTYGPDYPGTPSFNVDYRSVVSGSVSAATNAYSTSSATYLNGFIDFDGSYPVIASDFNDVSGGIIYSSHSGNETIAASNSNWFLSGFSMRPYSGSNHPTVLLSRVGSNWGGELRTVERVSSVWNTVDTVETGTPAGGGVEGNNPPDYPYLVLGHHDFLVSGSTKYVITSRCVQRSPNQAGGTATSVRFGYFSN